jgi:pilus assembly protein Flp/PilA
VQRAARPTSVKLLGHPQGNPTGALIAGGKKMIKRFFQEEEGQTLVEYGLLISLIALVVIAVLTLMGRRISNTFNVAANQMNN